MLDSLRTRLVMPLTRVGTMHTDVPARLIPLIKIDDELLALHAHQAAGIDVRLLKRKVAMQGVDNLGTSGDACNPVFKTPLRESARP